MWYRAARSCPALNSVAEETSTNVLDLSEHAGLYNSRPRVSEVAVVQIGDQLALAALPSDIPSKGPQKLEQVEGDRFRRMRDKEEGPDETWPFERDESGTVVAAQRHGSRLNRVE